MRKVILSVLFAMVILLTKGEVYTQTTLVKEKSCQPSTKEILSLIESAFNLLPDAEKVLIAGEIRGGAQYLHFQEGPLSLFQVIAKSGGSRKEHRSLIYMLRQSANGENRDTMEINFDNIKRGLEKDLMLEKGDVIFVARGCSEGKLLQPTPKKI